MSFRNRIEGAVDKAFNAVGDLVQDGRLFSKNVSGYDFSKKETISTKSSKNVKVIILSNNKTNKGNDNLEAIMKSGFDLNSYDSLRVGKNTYNLDLNSYTDDSFIIKVKLVREET